MHIYFLTASPKSADTHAPVAPAPTPGLAQAPPVLRRASLIKTRQPRPIFISVSSWAWACRRSPPAGSGSRRQGVAPPGLARHDSFAHSEHGDAVGSRSVKQRSGSGGGKGELWPVCGGGAAYGGGRRRV